jgi:GR25 family glycosyltransferase involved in LPS biosynthesis
MNFPMFPLKQFFDCIAVISLPDRKDRRLQLLKNLREHGLADPADITWVDAVDGRNQTLPPWWKAGPGAWGCRASQLAALTAAQRDGVECLLILEDDAVFHPRAGQWLNDIMPALPSDWEMFYLGGQHMRAPARTADPRILKAKSITRTHAYAVHRRGFDSLITAISDLDAYQAHPGWHIDHQFALGHASGQWQAYAPAWWLAGQEESYSNIGEDSYPRRWWHYGFSYLSLPFVTPVDSAAEGLTPAYLTEPPASHPPAPADLMGRSLWLRGLAHEAWFEGRLPTCGLPPEEIRALWSAGHRHIADPMELARLADYPANNLFPHPFASIDSPD